MAYGIRQYGSALAGGNRFNRLSSEKASAPRPSYGGVSSTSGAGGSWATRSKQLAADSLDKISQRNLQREYESAYRKSAAANKNRAAAISGGYRRQGEAVQAGYESAREQGDADYSEALGALDEDTGQRRRDVVSQYNRSIAQSKQSLARTGLSNTTVGAALESGYARQRGEALNRVDDANIGARVAVLMEKARSGQRLTESMLAGVSAADRARLGALERQTDSYPNAGLYAQAGR